MNLNPKKSKEIASAFLKRWPLKEVKQMSLKQYVGIKDRDTFCYWVETKTRYLGSIKGHYSNKFGIYERWPKAKLPTSDQFMYGQTYNWWKKYGNSRTQAFKQVKSHIVNIVEAAQKGEFDRIDDINMNHLVKWKVAALFSNERIVPIFKKETLRTIAQDLGISNSKKKFSLLYEEILDKKPLNQNVYQFAYDLYFKFEKKELQPNYWITVHWPRLKDQNPKSIPSGVYIPDGRQNAGKALKKKDQIFIYESLSGRTVLRKDSNGKEIRIPSHTGKKGIVAVVEATTELLHDPNQQPTNYVNSKPITWSWYVETKLLTENGFIPLEDVNKVLGYKKNYNLHGFGDAKSGLKNITHEQFHELLALFKKNCKGRKKSIKQRFGRGGESPAHLKLKNYVAYDPEYALQEEGLTTVQVEFPYPSADRADIILKDKWGKYIGVEIELAQDLRRFEGALQAIKYRFMAAYMFGVDYSETRSMLIAHKLSKGLIDECKKYDIECFIIKETEMI